MRSTGKSVSTSAFHACNSRLQRYLISLLLINVIWCSPVTFELPKGRIECFYILTPEAHCRITYYFAVQGGQSLDSGINHKIYGPKNNEAPIIERSRVRLGEWSFAGDLRGEYAFCFEGGNEYNKIVDLETIYECGSEKNANIWSRKRKARREARKLRGLHDPIRGSVENSASKIEEQLYQLENNLMYYKARSKRNHHTLHSADLRMMLFSIYSILLVIGTGLVEILILKWFFQKSRKYAV